MDLATLVAGLRGIEVLELIGDPTTEIADVTHDSRSVTANALFCAVPGAVADGHRFVDAAVAGGAAAVLVERRMKTAAPQIVVSDVRRAMGPVAASFHGHPTDRLEVVAVTGTNGKTTTCHVLAAIFARAGRRVATIGTLTGTRTTPEAPDLQRELARLEASGVELVAMEATSIGLDLHRMNGVAVDVAVFTNLSRDHLDVHGTMERYFQAKARLFDPDLSALAVVNLDDPYGRLLVDAAAIATVGFSMADVSALEVGPLSSRFTWRGTDVSLALGGAFNVANAIGAATAALELGVTMADVAEALADIDPVPGRFEPIVAGQDFTVLVDYAHTPDGLEAALAGARSVVGEGRVIVVFGCGGDRDISKRPLMGGVAARMADVAIITSDNPRHEDPDAIIDAVRSGTVDINHAEVLVEPDRRRAIETAVARANAGDVVLIAGKGHESTQIIGDTAVAFDDRAVAREVLGVR